MKLMVCFDGSSDNTAILSKAREHAKSRDDSIYLVSVLIGDEVSQLEEIKPAKKALDKAKEMFLKDDITCTLKVMFAERDAGLSLVKYAKETGIDEIIIGIQKRFKAGKFPFGSTAQHVILEAHCPVLTVK